MTQKKNQCLVGASREYRILGRTYLFKVRDLSRVHAVVEKVVLKHLGELRRVREQVAQEGRGELRERIVVRGEHGEGIALLLSALQRSRGVICISARYYCLCNGYNILHGS